LTTGNYIKVKRNEGAEISSTLDLAFAPLERNENPSAAAAAQRSVTFSASSSSSSKSEEEDQREENEQKHEVERMVVLQNLNYLDDVITNLETEKQNLENLWKSSTSDSETSLHRAAKSLWQKTSKQITVLNEKRKELMEHLKKLTFGEKLQTFISSSSSDEKNGTESSTQNEILSSTAVSEKKDSSSVSKAICQFFVFGTLFGVVITITVCTCFLQPRQQRQSRQCRVASISIQKFYLFVSFYLNPSRIPEPFDYSKPCFLKADSTGKFYASPIDGEEIPPLPTYEAALALPRSPSASDGEQYDIHHPLHDTSLDHITVIDSIEAPYPKEGTQRF
uniref:Uncharacterized protein n=1 Tax=Panagrolaimus sp. PS1159 TaxID=55785 RepID=A0AC35G8M0_9BILA